MRLSSPRASPGTERQTGEKDFAYPNNPATVDDPGRRRGGGAGRVRRGPTATAFGSNKNAARGSGISNEIVPFSPKQVIYEVFGTPGSTATINYQDVHAAPQRVDNVPLPWSYTITTTDPAVIANVVAQGNGNSLGLPHNRQRHRQRRKDRERIERLHLLPGQVRMSNHSSRRPFVPHNIHRLAVPILLFWVALAAVPNILVPQLEEVGRLHNVGLSSPEAPSYQAFKHIGKVFHEFDTDSSAMIVLEGDKPLGADAHKFYDALIHKLEQDKKHVFSTSRTSGETR